MSGVTTSTTTSVFAFTPSDTAVPPYSFTFSAEGNTYTGQATSNMAGQRWYLQIYDISEVLVISHPLISSPVGAPQNLAPGVFARTVVSYNEANAQITVVETDTKVTYPVDALPFLELAT